MGKKRDLSAGPGETAHAQELLESRWRVVELARIPDRLLIENNVGAIRNNSGHFARVVVDEEGAAVDLVQNDRRAPRIAART